MHVKLKGEYLGRSNATKKGSGFVRQFLHQNDDGTKEIFKVFSRDESSLQGKEAVVQVSDFVFL
ncbi:hypothetical protein [Desulfuromonas acetoxidans]|uniref:hypothetical protein n=1 Tax=Desulfuromonas acetoxidans TaxID=891 RepID=UPI00159326DA|nr:hypothetical protein [Desulfuromonas acetoxidans]